MITQFQHCQFFEGVGGVDGASTVVTRSCNMDLISPLKVFAPNVDALVIHAISIPYSLTGVSMSNFSRRLSEFEIADLILYNHTVSIPNIILLLDAVYVGLCNLNGSKCIYELFLQSTTFG